MKTTSCLSILLSILLSFSAASFDSDLELGIFELNRGEFKAAIKEFEPLVLEGYSPAQYQMALIYQKGYGVKKDQQKAFELFSLAAAQNYPDALFNLAIMYSEGKIVDKDLKTSFTLTEKAAQKGLASAQFNVGVAYFNGDGIKKDYLKASRWYEKAADQNYALAQFNLALMYFEGQGVPKDLEMSYIWNIISSYNGYAPADKSRIMDERNLNGDQIQQARDEANRIYKRILTQEEIKTKQANEKLY
ncbi:MAG: sel1 repeat family protein [Colwellia sp.]|nr:sel1 repeat family protein [Colwellia sp.]